jgi:chromosome segregation ATPase
MSTQPSSSAGPDLDRTDELPQLDVAAYEASLADTHTGLSRTDTWTVEALRDIDELAESAQQDARIPVLNVADEHDSEALTVNVERILKRIAEVEADIVAAHDANAVLQKRSDGLQAERDQQALHLRALEAENARLSEHRTLGDEMRQRLERQLGEHTRSADKQLKDSQAALEAARSQTTREREQLEHQISQMSQRYATLQESLRVVQDQLQTSMATASQRAQSISALEKSLHDEKTSAAGLARQLASKLRDCETLATLSEARTRKVDDLTRARDELTERLQQETTAGIELRTKLAAVTHSLDANANVLHERDDVIADKDRRLAELTTDLQRTAGELKAAQLHNETVARKLSALDNSHSQTLAELSQRLEEIGSLRTTLESTEVKTAAMERERATAALTASDKEQHNLDLQQQLRQVQQALIDLGNERDAAQAQIRGLTAERDTLLPASGKIEALTTELAQRNDELAQLSSELAAARNELESDAQLLSEKSDELTRMRTKFSEQGAAIGQLQDTVEARGELADGLMAQLQTARDERAIVSTQLEKARARVKSLTQHVFSRDNQIAELQADLAVHTEALAAIRRDVNRIGAGGDHAEVASADQIERMLEPIEHNGAPIILNGKAFTVGRTTENDVSIPSKLVSRHHARLLVGPNGVIVEDAGSTNGCYVNGEQVRQHLMRDGDVLELGDLRYRLCIRAPNDTRVRTNVVPIFDNRRPEE